MKWFLERYFPGIYDFFYGSKPTVGVVEPTKESRNDSMGFLEGYFPRLYDFFYPNDPLESRGFTYSIEPLKPLRDSGPIVGLWDEADYLSADEYKAEVQAAEEARKILLKTYSPDYLREEGNLLLSDDPEPAVNVAKASSEPGMSK